VAQVPHLLPRGRGGDCRQRRPSHPGRHASDSLLHMGRHVPGRIVCSQGQSSTPHVQPVGNAYNNLYYSHIADEIDWMLITSVNVYMSCIIRQGSSSTCRPATPTRVSCDLRSCGQRDPLTS
jgi:hypothetical protein